MQGQAAVLKREIEARLADRIPAALSPIAQQAPRLHPTGNPQIDGMLSGGLPLGSVCELTGPESSGQTSLALSLLASASREGACAFIDVSDRLSPHSAAAAGVELENLLWIRFRTLQPAKVLFPAKDSKPFERDGSFTGPSMAAVAARIRAGKQGLGSSSGADAFLQGRTAQTKDGGHTEPS